MALPFPTKVVLPFDIATAQDMNERHANDVALANGSGLDDGAVTADKIDFATFGLDMGYITGATLGTTGDKTVSGLGFKPRKVTFRASAAATDGAQASAARGYFSYGVMMNVGGTIKQFATAMTASTSYSSRFSYHTYCHVIPNPSALNAAQRFSAVSFNEDGFTINVDTASTGNGVYWEAEA